VLKRLARRFEQSISAWLNMYADAYMWVKTCTTCQACKPSKLSKAPLRCLPVKETIFERWHCDFLSLPKVGEYKHVLVAVDSFSLYAVLLPAKTTTAEECARLVYDNVFMVYSCSKLVSPLSLNSSRNYVNIRYKTFDDIATTSSN